MTTTVEYKEKDTPALMGTLARVLTLAYGTFTYLVFLGTFLYAIGFVSNNLVPKTVDSGPAPSTFIALAVNVLLLGLFAIQPAAWRVEVSKPR